MKPTNIARPPFSPEMLEPRRFLSAAEIPPPAALEMRTTERQLVNPYNLVGCWDGNLQAETKWQTTVCLDVLNMVNDTDFDAIITVSWTRDGLERQAFATGQMDENGKFAVAWQDTKVFCGSIEGQMIPDVSVMYATAELNVGGCGTCGQVVFSREEMPNDPREPAKTPLETKSVFRIDPLITRLGI